MPSANWNLEWLNHNSQRHYPLTADSTKRDTTGSFLIPDDFIVGMDIPVSPAMDMETGRFFLRQLGYFASGFQLIIAYETNDSIVDVATALIPINTHVRNRVYNLGGIEPFDDLNGKVVIGRLESIQSQPSGLYTFTLETARIEPQAVRPMIRGISSIRVVTAAGSKSDRLYGDIELVAGANIQLGTVVTPTIKKIIISALSGEGTIEDCLCEGEAALLPCIKTVNGIGPTPDGNFSLRGDDCVTISPIDNGLKLEDVCAAPCCGCTELEEITRELERFNSQRASLELFVSTLGAGVRAFDVTVLGSRLGDRRCVDCE